MVPSSGEESDVLQILIPTKEAAMGKRSQFPDLFVLDFENCGLVEITTGNQTISICRELQILLAIVALWRITVGCKQVVLLFAFVELIDLQLAVVANRDPAGV